MTSSEEGRARSWGWTMLAVSAIGGLTLEAMHGLKVSAYLDDELTRMLLRLAHAHGVGLSLVVLVYSVAGVPLLAHRPDGGAAIGWLLRIGGVLVPIGFALGAIGHPESDPSIGVWLVPVGGALLVAALVSLAVASFRRR
jgi:hypothetical protein